MNYRLKSSTLLLGLVFIIFLAACDSDRDNSNSCEVDFNTLDLLENLGNNYILPNYQNLKNTSDQLHTTILDFTDNPTLSSLTAAQTAFESTYHAYTKVMHFDFGPAEDNLLKEYLNNFPINKNRVDENILSGNYDPFLTENGFARGLPALDYLLYDGENSTAILEKFTGTNADNYKGYLVAISESIKQKVEATHTAWNNNYFDFFTTTGGRADGTPLSLLVNNLNKGFEIIKREKVAVPAGIATFGTTFPSKSEGFYSGHSLSLLQESINAALDIYTGLSGSGLDDYLAATNASQNGEPLHQLIKNQLEAALLALEQISVPFSEAVDTQPEKVNDVYVALQTAVTQLKTDMPTAMCIAITYIDNNPSDND